ncbi:MAG: hypothetical protein M3065_02430 [Actinomycetota bacterium]|nr:hypothetical protein [Actinomycetota bacterium]
MTMHEDSNMRLLERDLKTLAGPQAEAERVRLALRQQLAVELRPPLGGSSRRGSRWD